MMSICGSVFLGVWMCNMPAGHDGWHEVRTGRADLPYAATWDPNPVYPNEIGHINIPLKSQR